MKQIKNRLYPKTIMVFHINKKRDNGAGAKCEKQSIAQARKKTKSHLQGAARGKNGSKWPKF